MEKLGLPIAFAAALHGAVLFGFNHKSPKAPPPPKDPTVITEVILRPPEDPEPIILAGDASEASAPDREVLRPPSTPEPTAQLSDSVFIIEKQQVRVDVAINSDMRNIVPPAAPIGGDGDGPFKSGNIISSILLDRVPSARLQGQPIYPFEAKRTGLSGQVMVDFTVNARGDVVEARVVSSSDRVFEEAATRAVLKWKFEPGRRNGGVVPFRMTIPIQFSLND